MDEKGGTTKNGSKVLGIQMNERFLISLQTEKPPERKAVIC